MSVLDKLTGATSRIEIETICLDAALEAEHEQLAAQLPTVAKADDEAAQVLEDGASLEDPMPQTRAVVEAMEELRERMAASEVTFTFENIPWAERLDLQAKHRPRPGNLIDRVQGWNFETYTPALIRRCCTKVTDADGDTITDIPDDVWDTLLGRPEILAVEDDEGNVVQEAQPAVVGKLNFKQVQRLFAAAMRVTDRETQVPPSARSLLVSQDSGASLEQPSPGTSPRNGSTGGSRRTSRASTATPMGGSSSS